jgi:hypothetical protein
MREADFKQVDMLLAPWPNCRDSGYEIALSILLFRSG